MKARFKGNTIRLRLNQLEVGAILEGRTVLEQTEFPGAMVLEFSLKAQEKLPSPIMVRLVEQSVILLIDQALARDWENPDCISFLHEVPLNSGRQLTILIEKDYACLDRASEDEPNAFPNPKACASQ